MKLSATLLGAGLFLTLGTATQARPAAPSAALLFIGGGHAALVGGQHYDAVRKARQKKRSTGRSHRRVRTPSVGSSMSTGRAGSSSSGAMTAPTAGTSNVTAGGADTGQNSVGAPGSQRRRVTPPGAITNNGQATPQAGTNGSTGTTGGTP